MEITAKALQTVLVNGNVLFTETPIGGSCSIIHREGSGLVTTRGLTSQCRARFKVTFNGNIAIPTGQTITAATQSILAIAINGEPVSAGTMISTSAAVEQYNNVSATIFVEVPKDCCSTVSVKNVGTLPVAVEDANFIVERVA